MGQSHADCGAVYGGVDGCRVCGAVDGCRPVFPSQRDVHGDVSSTDLSVGTTYHIVNIQTVYPCCVWGCVCSVCSVRRTICYTRDNGGVSPPCACERGRAGYHSA